MRRPVKPFVTEYRGEKRRQAGGPGPGAKPDPIRMDAERSEPRASEPWPSQGRASSAMQEDGYEAALRAADALFSTRAPQSNAGAVPTASATGEAAESEASSSAGGRILRAIDEPPSPELLRLEAEFAPKRRGRKPGSKNKPKVPVAALEAAVAVAAEPVAVAPPPMPMQMPTRSRTAALPASSVPRGPRPAVSAAPGVAKGGRYAWVRTKLKPGQQWKRRLPKVAW